MVLGSFWAELAALFRQGIPSHHLPSPILNTAAALCVTDGQCLSVSGSLQSHLWAGKREIKSLGAPSALCLPFPHVQTTKKSGRGNKLPTIKLPGKELGHHTDVSVPPVSNLPPDDSSAQHQVCGFSPLFSPFFHLL